MIYVVTHIPYTHRAYDGYNDLYVGDLFDGVGENINDLNPYLNETTAMYWLWKNCNDDIIGLCHYRRFLDIGDGEPLPLHLAEQYLKTYDMIVGHPASLSTTIYKSFLQNYEDDVSYFQKYLHKLYPIYPGLGRYVHSKPKIVTHNIFVARRETIFKYFEWLFPVIIPLTRQFIREDLPNVKNYRLLGYICEILFGYWVSRVNTFKLRFEVIDDEECWAL